MKSFCDLSECTGCGLCAELCAKKCISMQKGAMGHLFPVIDQALCVDCGLCTKVCPSVNKLHKVYPMACYAAWAKDKEEYRTSTSGGVASILSNYIVSQGGVVYGCAMLPNVEVKHVRIDTPQDLYLLKGSKYVQSSIVDIMPLLKQDVRDGRKVLFVGTPCQVAAIKRLFKKDPENLFLVDLICHGVPSLKSLKDHVNRVSRSNENKKVVFRDGKQYLFAIIEDGKEIYRKNLFQQRYRDWYINAFMDGYTCRESCFTCQYACPERVSDITIGDFWKLGKYRSAEEIPEHNEGCSVILPLTKKGMTLIESVADRMNLYKREVGEAVKGNDQLQKPKFKNLRIRVYQKVQCVVNFPQLYYLLVIDKILIRCIKKVVMKLKKNIK